MVSDVSILILLEVVLEAAESIEAFFPTLSFNPYFAGSSSGSNMTLDYVSHTI